MATVDKTWTFATDNEGLADVGDSNISLYHETAGNPNGGIGFSGASGAANTQERARRASTGETWETWGVPSGANVDSVQIISWDRRKWAAPNAVTVKFRIVGSGASTVHSAGDLVDVNLGSGADGAWTANGSGTSRAVDGGSQASTTDVRLEIQINYASASSSHDLALDNILLRITYTEGGAAPQIPTLVMAPPIPT